MSLFIKIGRNLSKFDYQCRSKLTLLNTVQCLQKYNREFHMNPKLHARATKEYENKYAYGILVNKGYAINILKNNTTGATLSEESFQDLLQTNWSNKDHAAIFNAFDQLGIYCSKNNLCMSNKMFDDFIDQFTDVVKLASDVELKSLFYSLNRWPETESIRSRNFIEVWVALDDECLKRVHSWSNSELLEYVSLFYMIGVTKFSDFCVKSLNKVASKAKHLSPGELVQAMFFVGVRRQQPFDMHNLEIHLNNSFTQFSVDDVAIMAMGFFKSKTPIRDQSLVLKIINLIIEHSNSIHEVSLAALLKVIRLSTRFVVDDRIYRLLDSLQHEVPRLSDMCNVHMALVGTSTLTLHEKCLTAIANTIINFVSTARIKDLERLVLTYGTFNFIPQTKVCLFTTVMDQLRKPEREAEILKYGRSFACCVAYLGLLGIYPVDLINKVLYPEFLENSYGKAPYNYGKEILTLHNVSKIFCDGAVSNHLSDRIVKILAKKYTDYVPSEEYPKQYNVTEKMMLDTMRLLRECRGGKEYVIGDHILSHHQRGDIIVCNKKDGTPVPVVEAYPPTGFGLIRQPPDDNIWTVLVIVGRNAIIKDTHQATGHFTSKIRELQALGYNAALVHWSLFNNLESKEETVDYLNKLIYNGITNKESSRNVI